MSAFAKLQLEDVRDHWAHEEYDFSRRVINKIDAEDRSDLENVLELDLEVLDREKRVGPYRVDIVAETEDDERTVVIENQLGQSELEWIKPDEVNSGRFRCKIRIGKDVDLESEDGWDEHVDWLLDYGSRFHRAFHDRIQQLDHL